MHQHVSLLLVPSDFADVDWHPRNQQKHEDLAKSGYVLFSKYEKFKMVASPV